MLCRFEYTNWSLSYRAYVYEKERQMREEERCEAKKKYVFPKLPSGGNRLASKIIFENLPISFIPRRCTHLCDRFCRFPFFCYFLPVSLQMNAIFIEAIRRPIAQQITKKRIADRSVFPEIETETFDSILSKIQNKKKEKVK